MRRRGDYLIPLEKTKRVIRLDKRGKKDSHGLFRILFAMLGIFCALYFFLILFFMGYGSRFFVIWAFLAAGFGGLSFLYSREKLLDRIPGWVKNGVKLFVCLCLGLFILVEGMIFTGVREKAPGGGRLPDHSRCPVEGRRTQLCIAETPG